jgi:hypothetical protein
MDDEFIYAELRTISTKLSSTESLVTELKEDMGKICDWKDNVLPTLQTCKDYMEKRADLPDKIVRLEKGQEKLEEKEELNKGTRKDVKFLMAWYFKIAGAIGLLLIVNIILSLIKNISDFRGML